MGHHDPSNGRGGRYYHRVGPSRREDAPADFASYPIVPEPQPSQSLLSIAIGKLDTLLGLRLLHGNDTAQQELTDEADGCVETDMAPLLRKMEKQGVRRIRRRREMKPGWGEGYKG